VNLRQAALEGGRIALATFGLPSQPSLASAGIGLPKAPGIPRPGPTPSRLTGESLSSPPSKTAFNVGMGASTATGGAGGAAGEPAEHGRRQRSAIDRAFQRNEDDYATSSMPLPGAVVSP
jgi:hypothetical protein